MGKTVICETNASGASCDMRFACDRMQSRNPGEPNVGIIATIFAILTILAARHSLWIAFIAKYVQNYK